MIPALLRKLTGGTRSERTKPTDSVEKLADASLGNVFGGPRTITRWAIVDPGPF
jgi:hypothetical protein